MYCGFVRLLSGLGRPFLVYISRAQHCIDAALRLRSASKPVRFPAGGHLCLTRTKTEGAWNNAFPARDKLLF
jgi:hypothetical protein